jgi:hypothetical protein
VFTVVAPAKNDNYTLTVKATNTDNQTGSLATAQFQVS